MDKEIGIPHMYTGSGNSEYFHPVVILCCKTVTSNLSSCPCGKHAGDCCNGPQLTINTLKIDPCSVSYNLLSEENKLSAHGKRRNILKKCKKCNVGSWILECLKEYHLKARFT
jgi:hypothetical protein